MDPIQSHSNSDHHHHQQQHQDTTNCQIRKYKRRKIPKPKPQDLLSSLPKHLLLHILSFLPTKDAVKTGTLSKHWLYLWTSLPVLHFHDPTNRYFPIPGEVEDYSGSLVPFINQTLILHDAPKIQKLSIRLIYKLYYASSVDLWLRLATIKNVEELELDLDSTSITGSYELPQFLFKCGSLVRLKLMFCQIVPHERIRINWQNLESLCISKTPLSENAIREIVLGCPSLNFLQLCDCEGFDSLDINSSSVRELVIDGYNSSDDDSILDISVPYIQSLSILGIIHNNFRIVNAASLIDAKLDFYVFTEIFGYEECLMLSENLGMLNHVRNLTLGSCIIQLLSILEEETVLASLLSNRKCLTLDIELDERVLPVVAGLLDSSPDLETLIIDMNHCYDELLFEELLDSDDEFDGKNYWTLYSDGKNYWSQHKMYFKCSLLHVKTVKIVHFRAEEHEMELVQFLLKNARVLEKMVISLPKLGPWLESSRKSLDVAQKLLSFPRCSSDAVILLS